MTAVLDHLVYAVPDLEAAVASFAAETGVTPAPGGAHPGRGTRNALVGLSGVPEGITSVPGGQPAYLELLAPDPAQGPVPPEQTMLALGLLGKSFAPRMLTWAVRVDDFDGTVAAASRAGVGLGEVLASSRRLPSGETLSWRLTSRAPLALDGLQPFLIDWGGGPHPTDAALPTVELTSLQLEAPDPDRVGRALQVLGADVPVHPAAAPALVVTLGTGRGPLLLR